MSTKEIIDQLVSEARSLCGHQQLSQLKRALTKRYDEQQRYELERTLRTALISWLHERLNEAETLTLYQEVTVIVLDRPLNYVLPGPDGNRFRVSIQQILEWEVADRILERLQQEI